MRNLQRRIGIKRLRKLEALEEPLQLLELHGYIRREAQKNESARDSLLVIVNPSVPGDPRNVKI